MRTAMDHVPPAGFGTILSLLKCFLATIKGALVSRLPGAAEYGGRRARAALARISADEWMSQLSWCQTCKLAMLLNLSNWLKMAHLTNMLPMK